jgi:putative intracellular protease/amidase
MAKILIVLTSHTKLGNTGKPTGFYFDEMAEPYWVFKDAGHSVDIASIAGGNPKPDPASVDQDITKMSSLSQRFLRDLHAQEKLENTAAIGDVDSNLYNVIFLAGGHGAMWDFTASDKLADVVSEIFNQGGVVGAVCHGPAGLVNAKRADGKPLVEGLRVNGFSDDEERGVKLEKVVPFLLESKLRSLGGKFEGGPNFSDYAVRDGRLVTGQNPQSAKSTAELVVQALAQQDKQAA